MKVVIGGGGTAGHVFPAIAVARTLAEQHGADVHFVGTERGLEATLVPQAGFAFTAVEARPLVRKLSPAALRAPISVLRSVARCRPLVEEADAVLGMGGYASGPAVLAAVRSRTPVVVHEQNAVPGLANRLSGRFAKTVALSFGEAAKFLPKRTRTVVTGNPVREEIARVASDRVALANEAIRELGLDEGRRTVVVFGGSQGAVHIDRAVVGLCRLLRDRDDLQLVLLTGRAHFEGISASIATDAPLLVRAFPFLDRMELAYAAANLVVSRAGATTVAEVTVSGVPSLLIPYPYATARHQEANARAVQRAGAASVLLDEQLTPEALADRVLSLVDHEERLRAMSERSAAFGKPEAAERVAELVLEFAA